MQEQQRPSREVETSTPRTCSGLGLPVANALMLSLLVFLFFVRGLSTVLIYSLIPKLKSLFQLSYTEAMLIQLCFFLGYFIFSLPAAYVVRRLGYLRAIVLGLIVMMTGCLIILPSTWLGHFPGFLASLLVLAGGITLLQVADNPLIAMLGSSQGSYSRLTLAQAFNSLGTTVAPILAAWLVFGPDDARFPRQAAGAEDGIRFLDLQAIYAPFIIVAGMLAIITVIFWLNRSFPVPKTETGDRHPSLHWRLLQNRRFLFGAVAIFLYVGAEVSLASVIASYLMQATVLSVSAYRASQLLSLYWGSAMCGRFVGAAVLRVVRPGVALAVCGTTAALLALLSAFSTGTTAAAAIIAIGVCNSIMFPTIFALAVEGLGDAAPEGSGILCMAIVGGAIIPEVTGIVADMQGLALALLVPAACYVWIMIYGVTIARQGSAAPA